VRILLCSTYELGHQPFGLASPAAVLRADGHQVHCADLAVSSWPARAVEEAELIAFYLPMHTATRLAVPVIEQVRARNPRAHLVCYGLYAPLNEGLLRRLGVRTIIGGEFEPVLRRLARGELQGPATLVSLERFAFLEPDRSPLPPLEHYAGLAVDGERRIAGYTEASRGCKHLCRHCPVVPVYGGRFRIVPVEIVLADIRAQVEAGAEHITFGDPDFFNGPAHAARVIEALHREFPALTYDVTIKIEHLLRHSDLLGLLARTGCLFITSAAESIDDGVLARLRKGHTLADFLEAVRRVRAAGIELAPTFIPFTPWTSWEGYRELLRLILEEELVANVAPIQLALRLLIPAGSLLLELEEVRRLIGPFDEAGLLWRWKHPDESLDELAAAVLRLVAEEQRRGRSRAETFARIWELAYGAPLAEDPDRPKRTTIPFLEEPWYC
jgi:radical SAM superfamily enzyme YgiQ (UPF0313 family)